MSGVNIHEAKTHLSKLIEKAAQGESFVIAKAGKPLVRVTAIETPVGAQKKRIGFLAGRIMVPDDFNTMGNSEIQSLFEGTD